MKQGNVKWFDCKKGYGFITPDGEVKDVFVHITQLEKIGIRKLFDLYSASVTLCRSF